MSHTPQKQQSGQKMCKSPKTSNFQKHDKIDYENLSTNCTVVGSNNLNLVKKPQIIANVSPAYSNPSPGGGASGGGGGGGYPQSPYSSPASLKSPSPSLKPPTPQPQPNFPVMQILPNHPLLARPIQTSQPQNIIKLKPHLNILPKPAASPQPSPKPSVSPQSVILNQPTATIMPTAQPLLLNQMPMITTQFILRPQTAAKIQTPMHTATATPQGLILQSSGQPLLQIQPPRSQPMVRVLTNGMQLAPSTTTYVTQMGNQQPITAAQIQAQPTIISNQVQQQQTAPIAPTAAPKRRPKNKVKKKLDLANIMKLSGIGDEDDIQFESDASQSENEHNSVPNTPQPTNMVQTSTVQTNLLHADAKKIGNIQISAMPQPTINAATPVVQVLNQNFQSGVISNSTSQAATAQAGIPITPFLAPNFTINNGLMLQRSSGGLKLTVGEDGRLVLQHDPTINNDLQSQLILQSLLNLNGGLVLQPSVDQQTVQQTVQTIQQQSVQTIQQQTVQSQTIQTVQQQTVQPQAVQHLQHALQPQIQQQTVQQTIQHQTVQSQPLTAHLQQPLQIVQPQPQIVHSQGHSIQSQVSLSQIQGQIQSLLQQQQQQQQQHQQQNAIQTQPISFNHQQHTQPVLKVQPFQKPQPPVQTVHPIQSIQNENHQQAQAQPPQAPPTSYVVNLTPEQLEQLKRNGQLTVNGQTIFMQRPNNNKDNNEKKHSPKIKPVKKVNKIVKSFPESVVHVSSAEAIKPLISADKDAKVQKSPKHTILPHPIGNSEKQQPSAMVSPQQHKERQKSPAPITAAPKTTKVLPTVQQNDSNGGHSNHDVDKLLGQLLEESNLSGATTTISMPTKVPPQRITTIQLTPQKQQHLKSIQLQIQTLSARLTPGDTEMQNALKLLFNEQQKILASGKLLSPDKVYYHNNQLTIVNPSVNLPSPVQVKCEMPSPVLSSSNNSSSSNNANSNSGGGGNAASAAVRSAPVEAATTTTPVSNTATVQPIPTTQAHVMKISVPVPPSPSTEHATQTTAAPPILHTHTANHVINQRINVQPPPAPQPTAQQQQQLQQQQTQQSIAKKAQLIETQLNLDQNGAVKPDVHTPFKDKKDACIRLIRYHCMDQPVLSQKDLHKADEIFELTARHFIGKYDRMIDKYRYLLMKESMRQVQTSELMMLDRMFLAEEQQSLMRLRQEYDAQMQMDIPMPIPEPAPPPPAPPQPASSPSTSQYTSHNSVGSSSQDTAPVDDYDEWACIQRELGCLPEEPKAGPQASPAPQPSQPASISAATPPPPAKRSASTDSRLETLKRFRVDKHSKKCPDSVHMNNCHVSASGSVQNVVVSTQYATRINSLSAVNSFNSCASASSGAVLNQQTAHVQAMAAYSSQVCTFDAIQQQAQNQQQQQLLDGSFAQEETEPENNSLDEQVQSAIDSILNLQQNTAPLDLDSILS